MDSKWKVRFSRVCYGTFVVRPG